MGCRGILCYAELEDLEGAVDEMEMLASGLREVDEKIGAFGGCKVETCELNWRGKQSLIGADLVEGQVVGEGQGKETAIGGVEKAEAVEARFHLEVGPYLAVDEDEASEELGDPGMVGIAGVGVEKLSVGRELAIREYERDLVFARGELQRVFDGIAQEHHAEESGVCVESIQTHSVVVIPEGGCFLLERVYADAGLSRDEPVFRLAVVFGRILSAVHVDAGAYFRDVTAAAMEGVVDGKEVPGGQ